MKTTKTLYFWIIAVSFFAGLVLAQYHLKQQGSDLIPGAGGEFTLQSDEEVWLTLLDGRGRVARKEKLGQLVAGKHQVILQRADLPAGMYFFRLENASGLSGSGQILIRD